MTTSTNSQRSAAVQIIINVFELKLSITQSDLAILNSDEKEIFLSLPTIDRLRIDKIKKDALTYTQDQILSNIPFPCTFSPPIIEKLLTINTTKQQVPKPTAVYIFFNALTILYYQTEQIPIEASHTIIKGLMMCCLNPSSQSLSTFFFTNLINRLLSFNDTEWDMPIILTIMNFIFINPTVDGLFYQSLTKICQIAFEMKNEELNTKIFTFLIDLFMKKRTVVKKEDQSQLLQVMTPFIENLHPHVFSVISAISLFSKCQSLKDIYLNYASILANRISDKPLKITAQTAVEDLPQFELPRYDQYNFIDKEQPSFRKSLRSLPDQILEEYDISQHIPKDLWNLTSLLSDFLKNSSMECADNFFYSLYDLVSPNVNEDIFYGELAVILVLLRENATPARLAKFKEMLLSDRIFDHRYVVFSPGGLDPIINHFRTEIVVILAEKDAQILMDIMKKENVYLFVELLGRLLARSFNMDSFSIYQSFYKDVVDTAFYLQFLDVKQHTDQISIIRSIVFIFIVELAKYPTFLEACFISNFIHFIFESEITDYILFILKTHFSLCKTGSNFIPLVERVSLILRTCAARGSKDNRYSVLTMKINNMFISSLMHSMRAIEPVNQLFDSIFLNFRNNPNPDLLDQILAIIYYISSRNEKFALKIEDILTVSEYMKANSLFGKKWYIRFLGILSNCSIISPRDFKLNEFYFVERPQFMLAFLAVFGKAPSFEGHLRLLSLNSQFSSYTARNCHDGCLDIVLLKYLAEGTEDATISHHGINIDLRISKHAQKMFVFPLLISMFSTKISYSVVSLLHKLCRMHNVDFLTVFEQALSKCASNHSPSYLISSLPVENKAVNFSISGTTFSFSFWFKLDAERFIRTRPEITFFSVSDKKTTISLLYTKNNIMILRVNDPKGSQSQATFPLTLIEPADPLEENVIRASSWQFFGISFVINQGKHVVGMYHNDVPLSTSKPLNFPPINFSKGNLDLQIGLVKTEDPQRCRELGFISDFRFSTKFLRRADFHEIFMECSTDDDLVAFNSYSSFFRSKTLLEIYSDYAVFQQYINALSIVNQPSFLMTLKYIFASSLEAQSTFDMTEDILDCVLQLQPRDSSLYSTVYSIFEVIKDERLVLDWLDSLIFNIQLWMKCDKASKYTILCHWNSTLVQNYSNLLKTTPKFSFVLLQFEYQFGPDEDDSRSEYMTLLSRLASLNFVEDEDSRIFMNIVLSSTKKSTFPFYLQLVRYVSQILPKQTQRDLLYYLHSILQNDGGKHIFELLSTIHDLSFNDASYESIVLARLLPKCVDINTMFKELITHIDEFPNFYPLLCFLSLQMTDDENAQVPGVVSILNTSGSSIQYIGLWYMWPIIMSFHVESKFQKMILDFVAIGASRSAEKVQTIQHICHLITYLSGTNGTRNYLPDFLIPLVSYIPDNEINVLTEILNQFCYCIFFQLSAQSHNSHLIKEFKKSQFYIPFTYTLGNQFPRLGSKSILELEVMMHKKQMPYIGLEHVFNEDGTLHFFSSLQIGMMVLNKVKNRSEYAELLKHYALNTKGKNNYLSQFEKMRKDYIEQFHRSITNVFRSISQGLESSKLFIQTLENAKLDSFENNARELLIQPKELTARPKFTNMLDFCRSRCNCPNYPLKIKKRLFTRSNASRQKILPIKKAEFSMLDAKLVNIRKTRECCFNVSKEYVQIIIGDRQKLIKNINIETIYYTDSLVEFVINYGRSYLVNIYPQSTVNILKVFRDYQIAKLSRNNWTSNFEYLLHLNLISCRSFSNPEMYPIFPNILANFNDYMCRNIAGLKIQGKIQSPNIQFLRWSGSFFSVYESSIREPIEKEAFLPPEYYYFPGLFGEAKLPSWATNKNEFVYKMRKLLESPSVTKNLPKWIDKVWGEFDFLHIQDHKVLFQEAHFLKDENIPKVNEHIVELYKQTVIFAECYEKFLCTVTSNNQIQYFTLTHANNNIIVSRIKTHTLENDVSKYDFFSIRGKVAAFNKDNMILTKYEDNIIQKPLNCDNPDFQACGKTFFYIEDLSTISSESGTAFRSDIEFLCYTASEKYSVLAFATVDNVVHIRSLPNGKGDIQRKLGGMPLKMLITDAWGFIVIQTPDELIVLDQNGEIIKTQRFKYDINYWTSFRTTNGFDYIMFQHKLNNLCAFEVMYPENVVTICDSSDLMTAHFLNESETILVVTKFGKVMVHPVSITNLFNL